MKDLRRLKYFLGIKVLRSEKGIFIFQRKYILDMLAKIGLVDCKPAKTPIVVNHGLRIVEGGCLTDKKLYQKLVGRLIYLSHTRPDDIAYLVRIVSRFMHKLHVQHMDVVFRIMSTLKVQLDEE